MKELLLLVVAAMMSELVIPGMSRMAGAKGEEETEEAALVASAKAPAGQAAEPESAEPEEEESEEAPQSEEERLAEENDELKLIVGEKELELHRLRQQE